MRLPAINYSNESLKRFSDVIAKEWLITNGLGGYASSTVLGINTRKYHGLLVAALNPPGERTVCFSKLDEDILVGDQFYQLGSNEFQRYFYPEGYKFLQQFSINPYPTYYYIAGNVTLQKSIFLINRHNMTTILYHAKNDNKLDAKIRLYPMLTCRHFHKVIDRYQTPIQFSQVKTSSSFQIVFEPLKQTLICRISEGEFVDALNWVDRLHYRDESSRGEADFDDCFQPGYFELSLKPGEEKEFIVSCAFDCKAIEAKSDSDSLGTFDIEVKDVLLSHYKEKEALLDNFYSSHPKVPVDDWLNWILLAADSFIVQDKDGNKSIIAGYHWFESWGRDTFISLPGLLLVQGRFDEAKNIIRNFTNLIKNGLVPNFITDKTSAPSYNTVDATFWFINAIFQYVKYTGDLNFIKFELWPNLQAIIQNHIHGTSFNIHLDDDGLLLHGPQLTWMDALVDGQIVTPRAGKAVEIQCLWYNSLKIMEFFAHKLNDLDLSKEYANLAQLTQENFNKKFWNAAQGCLFDVLESKGPDPSVRPNQIIATSLDYSILNQERGSRVVNVVSDELLTPFGLRTLSLNDPKFVGKCTGDRRSRDNAYHNGTIWGWLIGPYVTAFLKVNNYSVEARNYAFQNLILPYFSIGIQKGGLGTINEIYDCDEPNDPRGCISQAWSVAEPLRAYVEDVLAVKPRKI